MAQRSRTLRPVFSWRAAICDSGLDPMTRLVAFVLSLHMSERGESCMPGVATVAHESGLSESAARRHMHDLRDKGWLAVINEGGGRGNPTEYAAAVPATLCGGKGCTAVPLSRVETLSLASETLSLQGLNPVAPARGGRSRTLEDARVSTTNADEGPNYGRVPSLSACRELARTRAVTPTVTEDELAEELASLGCAETVVGMALEEFRQQRGAA